jgi:hypothetical protein
MRILLVDDDEALMDTLAESLIRQRYAVDIAVMAKLPKNFRISFPTISWCWIGYCLIPKASFSVGSFASEG